MDSVSKEVRLVQEVYDLRELEKKIAASDFDADNDGTAEVVDVDVMQAYVDGKKTPLLQADTMFCAVKVDEGTHEIELRYRTPGMAAGACISIAALLIIIAQEAAGRLRKKELRKKKRL